MPGQEADHLTGHLKIRHPPVEIDPVKTLQIQTHMPIQDIVHLTTRVATAYPQVGTVQPGNPGLTPPPRHPPTQPPTSAVRGEASLARHPPPCAHKMHNWYKCLYRSTVSEKK